MKKVYYEIHEFEEELLKNLYYYSYNDILVSKNTAEQVYKIKVKEARFNNLPVNYKLVLAIIDDYQTNRHVLNEKDSNAHQLESMVLSGLTGTSIEIPEWPLREARMFKGL